MGERSNRKSNISFQITAYLTDITIVRTCNRERQQIRQFLGSSRQRSNTQYRYTVGKAEEIEGQKASPLSPLYAVRFHINPRWQGPAPCAPSSQCLNSTAKYAATS